MRIRLKQRAEGIAIFVVLVAIFGLSAIALAFAYSMKVETRLAATSNNGGDLDNLGRSGIEVARWALCQDKKHFQYDALDQGWAGFATSSPDTNDVDPLAGFSMANIQVGDGTIEKVTITDVERKFNINNIFGNEELVERILTTSVGVDAADAPGIVASIEDWIDQDDDTRINGAESEYYQGLPMPYNAKNGLIDDINELKFIKGIYETNMPKMKEIFTCFGSGRVNINTADATVLEATLGIDDQTAGEFTQARAQLGHFKSVGEAAANVPALAQQGGGTARAASVLGKIAGVRSMVYEVEAKVSIGMSHRTYHALLVFNNPTDIEILYMYWE